MNKTMHFNVTGMSCAACSARVEKAVGAVAGVSECSVSLLTNSMRVEGGADEKEIIKAVEKAGYGASKKGGVADNTAGDDPLADTETPKLKKRLTKSLLILIVLMYFSMGHNMLGFPVPHLLENPVYSGFFQMLLAVTVMIINSNFYTNGFGALFRGGSNMDTLVAVGSSAAFLYSAAELFIMVKAAATGNAALTEKLGMNLYFESAAMIPALITVGKLLEAISKGKTTDALKSLMKIAPKTAILYLDGKECEVAAGDVQKDDIFVVKSGGNIPVDGDVIFGTAAVDESALTGESIPADKEIGSRVFAATTVKSGYIRCKATSVGEDTTISGIINTVANAAATKAPIGRIADKVSGIFVPCVLVIALLTLIGWLISGKDFGFSVARAVSVLVISCPCALGLATPVAIMVASGVGAKNGILYKTASALEMLGKTRTVALDKTGTITNGTPIVTDIIPLEVSENELLTLAAALEKQSEHPLSRAIVKAAEDIVLPEVTDFEVKIGKGISGRINGSLILGGSYKYISQKTEIESTVNGRLISLAEKGKTPLLFTKDDILMGIIAVADTVKEDSAKAISELKNMGVRVVMLTGDNEKTAAAIAETAGIEEFKAEVLPEQKAVSVNSYKKYGRVAMVGDGINDAPALTVADIGIAVGTGADIAADSADIVLIKNRLTDVTAAIRLSRFTITNIRENLFWAFFYNAVCIPLAIGLYGIAMNPMYGAAAMAMSSFCVCMNALRLNRAKIRNSEKDKSIKPKEEKIKMIKTIYVEGMMCAHCEARVKSALEGLKEVETALPDHNTKMVTVTLKSDISDETLKTAVQTAGYEVIKID